LLTQVIRQQIMFNSINRSLCFLSDLFQPHPNQDSTTDMVSDNPGFSTLASLQPGKLLGLPMKLLNLPAQATHFLYSLCIVLSQIVGYDIVRALGRQHHPEQFHFVIFWKAFDFHDFAVLLFYFRPFQFIYSTVRLHATRIVHLAIVFERAVIHLFYLFDEKHHLFSCIPTIHQNSIELKLLLVYTVGQHLMQMIQLRFTIPVGIVDTVIDNPKLVGRRIDIDLYTSHYPNSFNHTLRIPAVWSPNQCNVVRVVLFSHSIIKHNITVAVLHHLFFHIFPNQVRRNFVSCQVAVKFIVTKCIGVVCKISQHIIDLTTEQILTVVQTCDGLFRRLHNLKHSRYYHFCRPTCSFA
jgi:hypothetical protein